MEGPSWTKPGVSMVVHSTTLVVQYHIHPHMNQQIQMMGKGRTTEGHAMGMTAGSQQERGLSRKTLSRYDLDTKKKKRNPELTKLLEEHREKHHQEGNARGKAAYEGGGNEPQLELEWTNASPEEEQRGEQSQVHERQSVR